MKILTRPQDNSFHVIPVLLLHTVDKSKTIKVADGNKTYRTEKVWHPLILLVDADNINNSVTMLGKLCKCGKGRLEVINYSNVSLEPCHLRRAGHYNMHVRSHDETTP